MEDRTEVAEHTLGTEPSVGLPYIMDYEPAPDPQLQRKAFKTYVEPANKRVRSGGELNDVATNVDLLEEFGKYKTYIAVAATGLLVFLLTKKYTSPR